MQAECRSVYTTSSPHFISARLRLDNASSNLQGLPGAQIGTDAKGNLYAGGIEGTISVFAPGSKTAARVINAGATGFYSDLTVTPDGSIYWPNYDNAQDYEFAAGASSPANVFEGGGIDAAVGYW